jgi:type II secretory pathway component PulF
MSVDRFVPFFSSGIVFFSGIALTFLLLTVLPHSEGRQGWALYPALGALALVVMQLFSNTLATTFIVIALIVIGWVLLQRQRQPKPHAG